MGFMVEGSTGARAVAMLKGLPQGTILDTPEFAMALGVKPGALHQLLANAVNLRLIKKVRTRGNPCMGWKLGGGNESSTVEPRRSPAPPPTAEELERRRRAEERRMLRAVSAMPPAPAPSFGTNWPPGFVSTFSSPALRYRSPADSIAGDGPEADPDAELPTWLRGLVQGAAPAVDVPQPPAPAPPRPQQLPLFDAREIGEPGRLRWRRLDVVLPSAPARAPTAAAWRQVSILEA